METEKGILDYENREFSKEDVTRISYLLRNLWDKRETENGIAGEGVFGEWLYLYYPEDIDELLQKELKEEGFLNQLKIKEKPSVHNIDWHINVRFKKTFMDLTKEMIENGAIMVRDKLEDFNSFITNMKDFEYYQKNLSQVFDIRLAVDQTPEEWMDTQFSVEDGVAQLQESYDPIFLEDILEKHFVEIEDATGIFSTIMFDEFNWMYDSINKMKKYDIKLFMKAVNIKQVQAPDNLNGNEYLDILRDILSSNLSQSERYEYLFENQEKMWNDVWYDRVVLNGLLPQGIQLNAYTPKEFKQEFAEDLKAIEQER